MPAKHYIDNESNLIITTWEGEAIDADFIEALKKYQKYIQLNAKYIDYNEVVNFSKVTNIKLTIDGLLTIGRIASKTDNKLSNKRMALIVGSYFAFSLANLYVFYRNMGISSRKKIRVFKNEDEAYEWVKSNT